MERKQFQKLPKHLKWLVNWELEDAREMRKSLFALVRNKETIQSQFNLIHTKLHFLEKELEGLKNGYEKQK